MSGWGDWSARALARLRDKYWFLPALATLAGLAAGIGLIAIDTRLGEDWLGQFKLLYGSRPEGARAMLSTIAGSTITVAGTVFSITLAAVTYASGQHGPRLLTNFARDRGNQLTLGVFIGTYVYCLIVLRNIRSAGEEGGSGAFVPHLAVYGALALALASIGMLIYFFHHVTETIHINRLIARIGRSLLDDLADHDGPDEPNGIAPPPLRKTAEHAATPVPAARAGYIESIDQDALAHWAKDHDPAQAIVLRLRCRPGDFVQKGAALADLLVPAAGKRDPEPLQAAFAIGDRRTDLQDLRFGFDELAEIAIRALSPGINDPFTAIACVDWLTAALAEGERCFPAAGSESGRVERRVWTLPLTFDDMLNASFAKMRTHAVTEANVMVAVARALEQLAAAAQHPANHRLLLAERSRLEAAGASC